MIIKINRNYKLYNIIKKDKIFVNSRHNSYIVNTDLYVSATNNIIEAIEDKDSDYHNLATVLFFVIGIFAIVYICKIFRKIKK